MITLNISPDGDITISQETPGERIYMGEHYARVDREQAEALNDDQRAKMFKQGWESAIREAQLNYVNGRLVEFFNEMGATWNPGEDPHHNEPEGTGEEWKRAHEYFEEDNTDVEIGVDEEAPEQPLIRPAVDSGEPEKEADAESFRDHAGRWIIPDEEFQAIKDGEFQRGLEYESPTTGKRYTDDQITEMVMSQRRIQFSSIRSALDRASAEVNEEMMEWERKPDSDVMVQPNGVDMVMTAMFRILGFEVVR